MAYFTDSMSDEFKKALEEAMKELEDKKPKIQRSRKSKKGTRNE